MSVGSSAYPPPWALRGRGYIFLYRFDRAFIAENGQVPAGLMSEFRGGFGSVMLIDYTTSPVGPYRELLFIPGRFQFGRRRYYHITRIYVSTMVSVENGQENWGIPKAQADFEIEQVDERVQRFRVSHNGELFFQAETKAGLLRLPINTAINPFPARLLQRRERDGAWLSTEPYGGGTVSLVGTLNELTIDGAHFPDVTGYDPLAVIEVVTFRLNFPIPQDV
jgi:hypothetical protein